MVSVSRSFITLGPATRANRLAEIELTILMPCLNEAETLATCIGKAKSFLERTGITGEVVVDQVFPRKGNGFGYAGAKTCLLYTSDAADE